MKLKILFIIQILIATFNVNACDCVKVIGIKEAKNVFEGKVIGLKRVTIPFSRYEVTFEISKLIKGKLTGETVNVSIQCFNDGCCGIPFQLDEKYRIYTYISHGLNFTNSCTETYKIGD